MKAQILGLVVGVALLALALRGVDLPGLAQGLGQLDVRWLGPVAAIFLAQQGLRALRQTLLVRVLAPHATLRDNLAVLCMAFLLINTLPGRVGELARPVLLRDRCGLALGAGLAVVFFERLIDLGAALGMLAFTLLRPAPSPVMGPELGQLLRALTLTVGLPALGVALAAVALGRRALGPFERAAGALARRWPRAAALDRLLGGAGDFLDLLAGARAPRRLGAVLGLTVLTWALTAWLYVALGQGFGLGDRLGWAEGVGVLSITMLGTALPAPPGMVGVYEASCRLALARLGLWGPAWDSTAMGYALTLHGWVWGVQACTALWFFVRDGVHPRRLWAQVRGSGSGAP